MSAVTALTGAVAVVGAGDPQATDVLIDAHGAITSAPTRDITGSVDVSGCVITPGLVNAHHHLLQSAFRTLPGSRFRPMREWLTVMAEAYRSYAVDPELGHAAASVGMAESLLFGVTTVADHHLTWPAGVDPVSMAEATGAAARDVGGRLVFVRGTAGDDPAIAADSIRAIHSALIGDATRRDARCLRGVSADGMVQMAVGPSGVHADGPETFHTLTDVARDLGLRRRTQSNEQVDVHIAQEKYGRRPLELLQEWGWLESGVTLAHLCDVTDEEIAVLAASGVTATHAPGCDIPMGWGIAPVAKLLEAGVTVGLGTSGGGSNDGGHLLSDARLAMQISPIAGGSLAANTVIDMATRGSAIGLGRPELGSLTEGSAADLCVWDVSGAPDAGVHDPVLGLLWSNPGRRPRDVMVAGTWVVRDYELLTADSRELAARLNDMLRTRQSALV